MWICQKAAVLNVVFLNANQGYYVQELPFVVTLKKFYVEHYSNGMPKRFASDVEIVRAANPNVGLNYTIEVNKPLNIDGVSIYQASFGDGGSTLRGDLWSLKKGQKLPLNAQSMKKDQWFDWREFRPFNVEEKITDQPKNHDVRSVRAEKKVSNIGPSIQAIWRPLGGLSQEYLFYIWPQATQKELQKAMVLGIRESSNQDFRWIFIPVDAEGSVEPFFEWFARMKDPSIVSRSVKNAVKEGAISASSSHDFERGLQQVWKTFITGGFGVMAQMIDERVPADKREVVGQTYIKMVYGLGYEAKPKGISLEDAVKAMSALSEYHAPYLPIINDFSVVQSSGFQMTRSPGRFWVYLGSFMLIIGSALMFYVPLIRVWCWKDKTTQQWFIGMGRLRHKVQSDHLWVSLNSSLGKYDVEKK
jgi:cytochrome c biogenesis protein